MNKILTITFMNGETKVYLKGGWSDYAYDGKFVRVKKDDMWIGAYNCDSVFSVEVSDDI